MVFLNGHMYMVAQGYQMDFGATTIQSMIFKVNIVPQTTSAFAITLAIMSRIFGTIDQIASLELMGFVYTMSDTNSTGINLGKVNTATYSSMAGIEKPTGADRWRLYQTKVDNHAHRPVFAVPLTGVSQLYRVTSRLELLIDDTSLGSDFYHFDLQVARYRAMVVNSGTCA